MAPLALPVPEDFLEQLAERVAAIVLEHLGTPQGADAPYLTVDEAAVYLRAKRQRIYDLLSAGRLTRRKDGRRVLVSRSELDAYLSARGSSPVAPTLPPSPRTRLEKGLEK